MATSNAGLQKDHETADRLLRERGAADDVPDFSEYVHSPSRFVREVLGVESATRRSNGEPYQFRVLEDLAWHPRVAVRSGHGVGKSTLDAWAVIWFLLTHPFCRVAIIAPQFSRQVQFVLFAEIKKWVRKAKTRLPLEVMADRIRVTGFGDEWACIGLPATEPDRIEGFHSEVGVLLVLDEVKGIEDPVYDALQGALSGHGENRLLVTSTPGPPLGVFYNICTRGGDGWRLHHIPSPDSSLVSAKWVKERKREWGGAESSLYQMRVLGEFMDTADEGLIPRAWLDAAADRYPDEMALLDRARRRGTLPEPVFGIDPAGQGRDSTVVAIRRGKVLERFESWNGLKTTDSVKRIEELAKREGLRPWTPYGPAWGTLVIDAIGIGAGIFDQLEDLHYKVERFEGGFKAGKRDRYLNGRAESYWDFRTRLEEDRVALPRDEVLFEELMSVRWKPSDDDKVQLEPKEALKRRLGRSPDKADACVMAFYETTKYMSGFGTYSI